jgi:hypothetical protein
MLRWEGNEEELQCSFGKLIRWAAIISKPLSEYAYGFTEKYETMKPNFFSIEWSCTLNFFIRSMSSNNPLTIYNLFLMKSY